MNIDVDMPAGTSLRDQEGARQILERSIEEGLRSVVGQSGVEMILRLGSVEPFAADPRKLHELLVSIFADQGALTIERAIVGTLMDKLGKADKSGVGSMPNQLLNSGLDPRSLNTDGDFEHEMKVFRRFAETVDLPGAHSIHLTTLRVVINGSKRARDSMGTTASIFADAFVK